MHSTRLLQLGLISLICLLVTSCYDDAGLTAAREAAEDPSQEQYNLIIENPFVNTVDEPTSTFSIDADGGAYTNVRRLLNEGQKPDPNAIRTEEFINYFPFDYADPTDGEAIALNGEVSGCPWTPDNRLIRIGIKGKSFDQIPTTNFVLLIDVSGSMGDDMDLIRESLLILTESFRDDDRIAIVTYAGSDKVHLESTPGSNASKIKRKINNLRSGGSTNGADGIITAYEIAQEHFIQGGNNRIILITDGDFNVGPSSQEDLIELIEEKRKTGVFLTTIGTGSGNYQEGKMEQLANHGNGTYEYLDNIEQAEKLFVHEFSKLYTVAKDVKVQVTFNPEMVTSYRLIGYENRVLDNQDFTNDSTDAGELGAGQTVTALYEIVPTTAAASKSDPSFTIDFRYKMPDEDQSRPLSLDVVDEGKTFEAASENMRFAGSVVSMALLMRDSEYKGNTSFDQIKGWMTKANTYDPYGYRAGALEFLELARPFYE